MTTRVNMFLRTWTLSWCAVLVVCGAIITARGVTLYETDASSPFSYSSTHNAWIVDPTDLAQKRHISLPVYNVTEGQVFPIGRTLCLSRPVTTVIVKEIDDAHGHVWPIGAADSGSGTRDLERGCHDRISPTIIPSGNGAPPPGPGYVFKVKFNVDRGVLPPLVVPLQSVNLTILPPVSPTP